VWRAALDALHRDPERFRPDDQWLAELGRVAEGAQTTLGAYHRPWQ
jgi:O2-independent ubiquinone biosynthesis protein UbiU